MVLNNVIWENVAKRLLAYIAVILMLFLSCQSKKWSTIYMK